MFLSFPFRSSWMNPVHYGNAGLWCSGVKTVQKKVKEIFLFCHLTCSVFRNKIMLLTAVNCCLPLFSSSSTVSYFCVSKHQLQTKIYFSMFLCQLHSEGICGLLVELWSSQHVIPSVQLTHKTPDVAFFHNIHPDKSILLLPCSVVWHLSHLWGMFGWKCKAD